MGSSLSITKNYKRVFKRGKKLSCIVVKKRIIMRSQYDYVAQVKMYDMEKEIRAPSIRQLSILLGISHVTLRGLIYGSSRQSKWKDRITISRQPKQKNAD